MDTAIGIVMDKVAHVIEFYRMTRASPYLLLLTLSVNITSLFEAFLVGTISQSLQSVTNELQFVSAELLITMATLAAIVGALIGDLISDNMGRKTCLLIVNCNFIIGVLFMAIAPTSSTFVIGRTIIGLGVGMVSMSNSFYISEASPNRIQGMLISFRGFLTFIGNFISSHCNVFTVDGSYWRWVIVVSIIPIFFQMILTFKLYESPVWSYKQNKIADAHEALSKSFPPSEVGDELEKIRLAIERTNVVEKNIFKQIWNARKDSVLKKKIVASFIIQVVQQSIGLKTMTYCQSKLQVDSKISLTTTVGRFLGDFFCFLFIDRIGFKRLLFGSLVSIQLCLLSLTLVCFWCTYNDCSRTSLILFEAYSFLYYMGFESTPWALNVEMYTVTYRRIGTILTTALYWTFNWISTMLFLSVLQVFGDCGTTIFFLAFSLGGLFAVHKWVPETTYQSQQQSNGRQSNRRLEV